jgi:hypothetical protein
MGASRWASGHVHAGIEIAAAQQGVLLRYELPAGAVAVIGPGTIYRLRCGDGADGMKLLIAPARALPVSLAQTADRKEIVRETGVRLFV